MDYNSPCIWCDTPHSWFLEQGKEWTTEHLKEHISQLAASTGATDISITGGEPLIYSEEIKELSNLTMDYSVWIETNGSLPIWRSKFHWSMDLKCSSSGNAEHNNYDNLWILTHEDQVKFIISNRDDFCFAKDIVRIGIPKTIVVFQPAWKKLSLSTLIDWMNEDEQMGRVIIGTQLHKWIWPENRRGV